MTIKATPELIAHAQAHCVEHGSRLTEKRRQVLTGLLNAGKAMSAYELAAYCRTEMGANLLPMSVYRILEFLQSVDLVHQLKLANKYVACSHINGDHKHEAPQFLICNGCDEVKEVSIPRATLKSLAKTIESVSYRLATHQFELDCICATCASQENL